MQRQFIEYPIDGKNETLRVLRYQVLLHPVVWYMNGEKLKQLAARSIDVLLQGYGYGPLDFLALRWMEFKGYIRKVSAKFDGPIRMTWIFEITPDGREFHRAMCAPMGEW